MPLIHGKSKKAFKHNIEAEIDAGKPEDQALAIAYAIREKRKKMSEGGEVEGEMSTDPMSDVLKEANIPEMADGGEIEEPESHEMHEDELYSEHADDFLSQDDTKEKRRKMLEGMFYKGIF